MPARTTGLLSAAFALALAGALPAQAADDDALDAVLDEVFAPDQGGLFEPSAGGDERTEQAARLCVDYAEDKVRDKGGDAAHFERLIDAERDGDTIRLRADMSADYGGERRRAEVECEVDFEGHNEVTAFRQLDEAGSRSPGDDGRGEQAARLCLQHAEDKVRDKGGDDVRIERVIDAERDGDKVRLRADMSADYDGDRRSAEVACEVDFEGANEVTAFRQVGDAGGGSFSDLLGDLLGD